MTCSREPCLGHACHVILFLLQVINVLGKLLTSFTAGVQNDKCIHLNHRGHNPSSYLIPVPFKWSFITCVYQNAS